jgi:dimethylargininase
MAVFTRAIVRPPGASFSRGLTTANLGKPRLDIALVQHEAYCAALEKCGLTLTRLDADERFPDSTFVEDTAVLTERFAVLARPGAPSRQGEVSAVAKALGASYGPCGEIMSPGTLDGGDVCQVDQHFLIGLSQRTNAEGAAQLSGLLTSRGFTTTIIDIRGSDDLLHLKGGISWPGRDVLVLTPALATHPAFGGHEVIVVDPDEQYGANCVAINGQLLIPAEHPRLADTLVGHGFDVIPLPVSEFRKMDGGLSCLSLRF